MRCHVASTVRSAAFRKEQFELGEHLFDRVQVWRVKRQEDQLGSSGADRLADGSTLVAVQIVHCSPSAPMAQN